MAGTLGTATLGAGALGDPAGTTPVLPVTSGLKLRLDAGDMGVYADGASVATWLNLAAGGLLVTATATKPIYKTAILNGRPVVRTNGTTSGFTVSGTAANLFGAGGQRTIIFVGQIASVAAAVPGDDFENPALLVDLNDGVGLLLKNDGSIIQAQSYNYSSAADVDGSFSLSSAITLNTGVMLEDTFDGATMKTRRDGGTPGSVATQAPDGLGSAMKIVGKAGTGNLPGVDVGELLVYDRALTDTERRAVETYLVEKWLPSVTLPPVASGAGRSLPLLGVG